MAQSFLKRKKMNEEKENKEKHEVPPEEFGERSHEVFL